jgi:hypothetical protein
MALKRVWIPSPHYSSRGGSDVRLIVIHTAEGATTIESLGGWFQNPGAGCSSHVGADDKSNTVGEYVARPNKAWTQSNYNPVAVSMELCGFAAWSTAEWNGHPNMLDNCAKWVAEEAAHFGIPITRLNAGQAQGSGRGVCQHVDLGAGGGGHWDCGDGFPMDRVLEAARSGAPAAGQPTGGGDDMLASAIAANGNFHVWTAKGRDVKYVWQAKGSTGWAGGAPGEGIANFAQFAKAAADVVGLTADVAANGTMHLFVECDDGHTYYTYQRANESGWQGGEPGKALAGLARFA